VGPFRLSFPNGRSDIEEFCAKLDPTKPKSA
jgi:hypothetical protein